MADKEKESKVGDVVDTIERFFLDLIGTIIPGGLLLGGWALLFGIPHFGRIDTRVPSEMTPWLLVASAYVAGHLVTGLGNIVFATLADHRILRKIGQSKIFNGFITQAKEGIPGSSGITDVREWRNIAMTHLTPEQNHLVYRFMFISLLNLGAATVVATLIIAWGLSSALRLVGGLPAWGSVVFQTIRHLDWPVPLVGLIAMAIFLHRRQEFYGRALRLPFSMAIVRLSNIANDAPAPPLAPSSSKDQTLYLAGGTRTNWQDRVIEGLPAVWRIIDPRTHGLTDERDYSLWDLEALRKSDWVLAYLEATNPGGYNLALEIGFAKALGKQIILVDEKSAADENVRRYTGMLRASATATPPSIEAAIALIKSLPSSSD